MGTSRRAKGEVLPREPQRPPAITADGAPELGGMVGERLRVTGEQLVVTDFCAVTPGLCRLGPAAFAEDARELRGVVGIVGGERQRTQAGDGRRRLPEGGLDLGQVALRGDVDGEPVDRRLAETGRKVHQLFMGRIVVEDGQIKLLREALNTLAVAQVLLPGGAADVPAPGDDVHAF